MRVLASIELAAGLFLLCLALYFAADSIWCFDPHPENCGMVSPLVSFYAFLVSAPLLAAGMLHWKRRFLLGLLALLPSIAIFLFASGLVPFGWPDYHLTSHSSGPINRFAIDAAA
jgi:hypothetical protein